MVVGVGCVCVCVCVCVDSVGPVEALSKPLNGSGKQGQCRRYQTRWVLKRRRSHGRERRTMGGTGPQYCVRAARRQGMVVMTAPSIEVYPVVVTSKSLTAWTELLCTWTDLLAGEGGAQKHNPMPVPTAKHVPLQPTTIKSHLSARHRRLPGVRPPVSFWKSSGIVIIFLEPGGRGLQFFFFFLSFDVHI